jgi:hypothetical protein
MTLGIFSLPAGLHSGDIWDFFILLANGYHALFSGNKIDLSLFSRLRYKAQPVNAV